MPPGRPSFLNDLRSRMGIAAFFNFPDRNSQPQELPAVNLAAIWACVRDPPELEQRRLRTTLRRQLWAAGQGAAEEKRHSCAMRNTAPLTFVCKRKIPVHPS
jgi:hypothetical protein